MIGTQSHRFPHVLIYLVALGSGSCSQLCEIGGGAPVNLRYWVGVMPQRGSPAAAVAEPRRGVAQIEPCSEQLAGRVVPQSFDVELDTGCGRQVAGLLRGP